MNWAVWREVKSVLDANRVRPLVAIVPDNHDALLNVAPARTDFWELARLWQSQGWTMGLHGYRHVYVTTDPGIIGRNLQACAASCSLPRCGARRRSSRSRA